MIAVTGARTKELIFIPKDNVACIDGIRREDLNRRTFKNYPEKFTRISFKKSSWVSRVYCLETPEEVAAQMSLN